MASARPHGCSPTWRHGSAEGYVRIFGGNGKMAPTASSNCGAVACRSSTRRLPPARRPDSGACQDTRRSNRPCATRFSTASVFPDSMFLPQLNSIEPPWYGPVCPVVWEGWRRETSPYPDLWALFGHRCLSQRPLRADIVAKVFLGWRTKILRAADASYARRREGTISLHPKSITDPRSGVEKRSSN